MEIINILNEMGLFYKDIHKDNHPFVYMGLYGSQNYGIETEQSDVDVKTIILPTKRELYLDKKKISKEKDNESGGLNLIQDIRLICNSFYKGNINFLEILYTPYYMYNPKFTEPVFNLLKKRDKIANRSPLTLANICRGMALNKVKLFSKPTEGKKETIEKYGYDPKQLVHIIRLYDFLKRYYSSNDFEYSLKVTNNYVDFLRELKTSPVELDKAKTFRDYFMEQLESFYQLFLKKYGTEEELKKSKSRSEYAREILDNFVYDCLEIGQDYKK